MSNSIATCFKGYNVPDYKNEHWKWSDKNNLFYFETKSDENKDIDLIEFVFVDGYLSNYEDFGDNGVFVSNVMSFYAGNDSFTKKWVRSQSNNIINISVLPGVSINIVVKNIITKNFPLAVSLDFNLGQNSSVFLSFKDQNIVKNCFSGFYFDFKLEENAKLNMVEWRSHHERMIDFVEFSLGKKAVVNHTYILHGVKTVQSDVRVLLSGDKSEYHAKTLMLSNEGVLNRYMDVNHLAKDTLSTQVGRLVGSQVGKVGLVGGVVINKNGVGADAQQNLRGLLLSDFAEVRLKPALEIDIDDVSCSHGATISAPDKMQEFYLRSRGLSKEKARNMLVEAFISELIFDCEDDIKEAVSKWLSEESVYV